MKDVPKNSIDEDICSSLASQFKGICIKFSYVLIPRHHGENAHHLQNWDLWGPFFLCLLFAFFIDRTTTNIFRLRFISCFGIFSIRRSNFRHFQYQSPWRRHFLFPVRRYPRLLRLPLIDHDLRGPTAQIFPD